MFRYFVRRVLLAVPTLFIISLVVFGLSKSAPRDPALDLGEGPFGDLEEQEISVRLRAQQLGLDKPAFYFTLTTAAFPDTMYRVLPPARREWLEKLCAQTGNWLAVTRYEKALRKCWKLAEMLPDTMVQAGEFRIAIADMMKNDRVELLDDMMIQARQSAALFPHIQQNAFLDSLENRIQTLHNQAYPEKMNYPAFHWHGLDNQYHLWLCDFVTGDLGLSRASKKPVWESLKFSLLTTLIINGFAILLAYLIAVPLGVSMSRRRSQIFDRAARWLLLLLYAMPVFWLGSLLILFFATPNFGFSLINGINLEPWQVSGKSFSDWGLSNSDKFILPVFTLCFHALAVLALQMRGGMLDNLGQDFIRTARAKGVGESAVYWRHAFRNALFPIITIFASIFPAIFTGSIVVEYLFNIHGIGLKTQEAFLGGDYPMLFAIVMIAAVLTILGNLIADLLYAWADPRVRFARR